MPRLNKLATATVAARIRSTLKYTVCMPDDHSGMTDRFIVRTDDFDIVPTFTQFTHDTAASKRDSSFSDSLGFPQVRPSSQRGALTAACGGMPCAIARVNIAHCVCGWPSPPIVP